MTPSQLIKQHSTQQPCDELCQQVMFTINVNATYNGTQVQQIGSTPCGYYLFNNGKDFARIPYGSTEQIKVG